MLVWLSKDPDEEVLRSIDWVDRLGGDTITSASFDVVSGGVTLSQAEHDDSTISQVLISGGTAETRAKVLCEITTGEGQTLQQTATILVRAR